MKLTPDHPEKSAFRQKFLAEHIHDDFEVRFFVEGSGLFYLHNEDKVYAVLCEQGDLISVPANTTHWFDMGENPRFTCIRLFTTADGWVANFTGSEIAKTFPTFDQYIAELL
jgi:1,2-dihydroxy-3-keto-5-methylthiopentene dioxygenase